MLINEKTEHIFLRGSHWFLPGASKYSRINAFFFYPPHNLGCFHFRRSSAFCLWNVHPLNKVAFALLWFFIYLFQYKFIYFNWRQITLQYCISFAIHQHELAMGVHVFPSWNPLPPPSLYHLSGSSQCTRPEYPVSCTEPGLVIHFTYDIIHVSMPFSQIIPPSPSPTECKRLFYTSVSLLLSPIQAYCYHLPKFHIYALVYCIGVFLSGLLHSV